MADAITRTDATILVVDDDAFNRILVEALLDDQGYRVVLAEGGRQALEIIAQDPPDAILLDVMMPGMDGFEVCRRLKASRRTYFIPVVMLTALADRQNKIRGLDAGADEFLNKPIDRIEVLTRLRSLLRIRALRDELDSADTVMLSLIEAQESKGGNRRPGHALRVAHLAHGAARTLGRDNAECESVVWGALLHDIGKIGSPDVVLQQPVCEMLPEVLYQYRRHPEVGAQLLGPLNSLAKVRPVVRHHHERLDGSGYPDGLAGENFTLPIELVAVANALDTAGDDPTESATTAEQLQAAAERGAFRLATVEAVLAAAEELGDDLGHPLDLLAAPTPASQGRILLADDQAHNRDICREHLSAAGYRVESFSSAQRLLEALPTTPADLLLVDVNMPQMGGEQVCRQIRTDPRFAQLPLILMTAERRSSRYGRSGRDSALASGADDFIVLPIDRQELLARVRSLLRLRIYHQDLEAREAIIVAFSQLLEAKDPYTQGHSRRVGLLARRLAQELGLDDDFAQGLLTAGLLHDIGKVAVPDRILHKPGRLDADELEVLRSHPMRGWQICRGLSSVAKALPAIRHHHERMDGSGYPDRLRGKEIPLSARIMGLADAFDALTSDRPYRDRLGVPRTFEILHQEAERGYWDNDILTALEAVSARGDIARL